MIILTGASGGIGKQLIKHLLKIDDVVGIYNTSLPRVKQSKRLIYEQLDLDDPGGIKGFVKRWETKLSKVTIVHAAVLKIDGLAANYAEADWDRMMRINLKGNFLLTQALLPQMIREQWGRIVHISSLGGIEGAPSTIAYSTTKTGLIGMSRVLAKEYARFHITSNILLLGYFEMGLFDRLRDVLKKELLNRIPSKNFGDVSNIANAIDFLIKSEYVNGATINIDGGI